MDEHDVASLERAEHLLDDSAGLRRAIDLSHEMIKAGPDFAQASPHSVVTTGPLNLFGFDTCGSSNCMKETVNSLFSRTWHYFDRIVITTLPPLVGTPGSDEERDVVKEHLLEVIEIMLYIREIGAEDLIEFRRPLFYCEKHLQEHARDAGVGHVVEDSKQLYDRFIDEGTIRRRERDGVIELAFRHPLRHTYSVGTYAAGDEPTEATFKELAARRISTRMAAQLVSDAFTAREIKVPLASVGDLPTTVDPERLIGAPVGEVALQLRFPVLYGLPAKDLLALMRDERPHFIKFRAAVRKALNDHLSGLAEERDANAVAATVYQDTIEPALASLETTIKSASKAFTRKAAIDIAAGGLATTVGIIAGMPLLATTGIAAVADVVKNAQQYFDERKVVEQHDMYFLWHAARRTSHS